MMPLLQLLFQDLHFILQLLYQFLQWGSGAVWQCAGEREKTSSLCRQRL